MSKEKEELLNKTESLMDGKLSGEIWSEIKNKKISLFNLPPKPVHAFCTPKIVEPSKLYLVSDIPAFLPLLETLLGENYNVELSGKYITVNKSLDL